MGQPGGSGVIRLEPRDLESGARVELIHPNHLPRPAEALAEWHPESR